MSIIKKTLRFILLEFRDWFFAIVGIGGMIIIPVLTNKWYLAIPVLIIFVILYIAAIFASRRLLNGEDK